MDVARAGVVVSALLQCACAAIPEGSSDLKSKSDSTSLQSAFTCRFEDVTDVAGVSGGGVSFGASVGDFDGDGWPDLFVSNHYHSAESGRNVSLFRNRGDGSFSAVEADVFEGNTRGDLHGAAWADFDNDGDQDLFVATGAEYGEGAVPKLFFVNDRARGRLVECAAAWGLDDPQARGRTPLWVPWESPARLDLLLTALQRPDGAATMTLFRRAGPDRFEDASAQVGFPDPGHCEYAQLSDLDGDGSLNVLFHSGPGPIVLDVRQRPAVDLSKGLGMEPCRGLVDLAIADFDGDALPDVFELSRAERGGVELAAPKSLTVAFYVAESPQRVEFECASPSIQVTLSGVSPAKRHTWIGSHPAPTDAASFTVRRRDTFPWDDVTRSEIANYGLGIGFLPQSQRWVILAESRDWFAPLLTVTADQPIEAVETTGFPDAKKPFSSRLHVHESRARMKEIPIQALPSAAFAGRSVVAGDFDNDGDVDLFVVQGARTRELPDLLLSNRGDATFERVVDAAGAAGDLAGSGDSVVTFDYDRDGFLDLFVTNGEGDGPRTGSGRNRLFRNGGNRNHWLEVDLVGTLSNRDSIGATVLITAGGRTQIREQTGGMHRYSQSSTRIHFGLGVASRIDSVVVRWPSGVVMTLHDLAADQIVTIHEPTS